MAPASSLWVFVAPRLDDLATNPHRLEACATKTVKKLTPVRNALGPEESGPSASNEREDALADSQVVFHREDSGNRIRDDPRNILVHLIHDHAFESHVSILHDDMDLRDHAHRVPSEVRV